MTRFATLDNVPLTEAWSHEAHDFTPWLAENLDRLSDALNIQLVLEGKEVAVENFSADILARNVQDDSLVLIENQFQQSDHGHLGQIMTYLAGLAAHTVVWIAPRFREPHLSAIRWLNEHTEEPFAFFAVELKVVRIGTSPMVPIFDVVERPNDWERNLQTRAREQRSTSSLSEFRRSFWTHYTQRHPSEGAPDAASNRWRTLSGVGLILSLYVTTDRVGLFIRGLRGVPAEATEARLAPHADALSAELDAGFNQGSNNFFFVKRLMIDNNDQGNWDRAADWLKTEADRYASALTNKLGGKV